MNFSIGVITAVLTTALTGWIALLMHRSSLQSKPHSYDKFSGCIKPGKISAWLTVTMGSFFAVTGVFVSIISSDFDLQIIGCLITAFGVTIAAFMAPSLGSQHDVIWNDEGVEGPCKLFGPTLSRQRIFIAWSDFVSSGETKSRFWYLQTSTEDRIYWSYLYRGHSIFKDEVRQKCPHIDLPY